MSKWQDNYNKNSTKIVIPDGIESIPNEAFMNYENLEEVIIPESVKFIGTAAFSGCKSLKKINLPSKLTMLDSYAFSMCESLEEITIPTSLHYLSGAVFSRCTNLKKINIHDNIEYIDDYALYNCRNLEDFDIPKNTKSLGYKALMGCNKLKSIHIPEKLETIEAGALSMIKSLERITVDENNENFFSDEDIALISKDSIIIQYAINNKSDSFLVGYYEDYYGDINKDNEIVPLYCPQTIYGIYDYAFAGAKHLQKLIIYSELESIGAYTFFGCYNLKELKVLRAIYGDTFILNIHTLYKNEASIPFENIEFEDGIIGIGENQSDLFKSAKKIKLPNNLEYIGNNVFTKSKYLKELKISQSIKMISPNTFHDNIKLYFKDFENVTGKNFELLQTKTNSEYYIRMNNRDNIRILSLKDGTYYVKLDDYDAIKITKDEISKLSNSSYVMSDKPEDFIRYMLDLIRVSTEQQRLMTTIWVDNKIKDSFKGLINYIDPINDFVNKKKEEFIREIIDASGVYDEFLFSGIIMNNLKKEEIKKVLENYNTSINRYFRLGKVEDLSEINYDLDGINKLVNYCKILEEYQVYDRILYNPQFFLNVSEENQRLLISNFNKNIKRLIINSNILDNNTDNNMSNNMNDLLNFCNALGVFLDNKHLSQRITTYINERVFSKYLPNGDENNYRIFGDSIHSRLGEFYPREDIDYEFIDFFIDNYEELYKLDAEKSGSICRIYNCFRVISSTSTSHRGSQRHLKVTIKKCEEFFAIDTFENVTEENKELASLLQMYYSEPYALNIAETIVRQSKNAPRNIFSKVDCDEYGNILYSYDEKDDLKETNKNDFSYEWLPKQDYNNLILGKYCNCCAHILGAGAGIMRASMISDNCQNLVIRNKENDIIAKMTLYVNKTEQYGVYNTAEINEHYKDEISLLGIYNAFMRGTKAFLDKYNSNNISPISIITIGEYRNSISNYFDDTKIKVYETPKYSIYGYKVEDKNIGTYDGDSRNKQKIVIKK